MEAQVAFDVTNGRGFYRPTGVVTAGQAVDMITAALHQARSDRLTGVIINITELTGFEVPGPAFRRWAVRRWAPVVGDVRVAIVARAEHICPEKTGLLVAAEEGMRAHICESEGEAVAWFDATDAAAEPSTAANSTHM